MSARVYTGAATPTTLSGSITNVSTSGTITVATNWLTSGQFSIVVDPGLAGEEKILCTLSGTTLTFITRGYDGTTAASHNSGAVVYPVPTAIDFSEANTHVNASSAVHGLAGSVVGTTDTQVLTNKDLTSGTNTFPATLVTTTGTQTLTNKTLTAPIITMSLNAQSGTTYTPVLSDAASVVTLNNAASIAVTIPTNASVAYTIGTQLTFAWITGAGQPTISAVTPGTTTIISTGATSASPKLRVANSVATALKIATDIWLVTGDIA